jgi:4-aminobutyrate aminotransferase/(S)-3-amino-2-methylpropionate transaminase
MIQTHDDLPPALPQSRRIVTEIPGPKSREYMKRREAAVSAGVGNTVPIFIVGGGGGVLVDADGNSFIDLVSGLGVTNVGNSNPEVVAAVREAVAEFTHTCFMVTPYMGYVEVCEMLNALTPGDHDKRSILLNTGAEAVENAIKISRSYTGRQAVVALEHSYHGRTNLTMALTSKSMPYKHSFGPFAPEVYRVPSSYPFRDGGRTGEDMARIATTRMEKEIGGTNIAAIIVEPLQGEGGFIVPDPGYTQGLARYAKENGIVFIADEVQSGFCRTGDWFAIEHEGVIPDMVVTAKGIAGGLPLAAVTGRAEMMDCVHPWGLGGTFGGNPVSTAAALAAMQWMVDNDARGMARAIENQMMPRLKEIQSKHPVIGQIRGRGAMIGMEIVKPGTTDPDPERTAAIKAYCHSHGVIAVTTGTYANVFRFLPPLTIPSELLSEALDVIADAFDATAVST